MERVTVEEVLALAVRAEDSGQPNVARALYEMGGRMGRHVGWDGYDGDEPAASSHARGLTRAARLGITLDVASAAGRTS